MARIRLNGVRKVYGAQVAVERLDLEIADGELLVLLGPSGCGKTTTMNMIAGLTDPTAGTIAFDGADVTSQPPHHRNIAMVFQSSLLYPHLTARQNIAMSLKRSGLSPTAAAERISEAAGVLDIARLLDKMPSELSGGERQRVATAKAIVRHPAAFLLDEPLAALDAALRLILRSELVNLQKRLNTTMIFVTHDQTEAMTMGDRIAVMRGGSVQQFGSPDDIYNRPETLFVAGFVGSPPMNFFEGETRAVSGQLGFAAGSLRARVPDAYAASPGLAGGRKVTMAVRPQHLRVQASAAAEAMPVTVFALEHLGKESVVIFDAPGQAAKLRAIVEPGFAARVGDRLHVVPDMAQAVLFDPQTERAIPSR
jgi:ABC-type sugar transport system ATPase subunit